MRRIQQFSATSPTAGHTIEASRGQQHKSEASAPDVDQRGEHHSQQQEVALIGDVLPHLLHLHHEVDGGAVGTPWACRQTAPAAA